MYIEQFWETEKLGITKQITETNNMQNKVIK